MHPQLSVSTDGPADAPAILLINSIGSTRELWDSQVPDLARRFRVIRYDARGHGRSAVPPGEYSIADLGVDALNVLDATGTSNAHVCGISLGGLTGMWLGINAPLRVKSLVLANTAARIGSVDSWTERIELVAHKGMAAVAELAIPRWFSATFRERNPAIVAGFSAMIASCPQEGYLGCCAALRDADLREAIAAISCPVLAVAGTGDVMTPPDALRFITERVSGSRLVTLEAAHLSNVEQAAAFTTAVLELISGSEPVRA